MQTHTLKGKLKFIDIGTGRYELETNDKTFVVVPMSLDALNHLVIQLKNVEPVEITGTIAADTVVAGGTTKHIIHI